MTPDQSQELENLFAEKLADYQSKLDSGIVPLEPGAELESDDFAEDAPGLNRARQCLELLHLTREFFLEPDSDQRAILPAQKLPDHIGRFEILECLGVGGFGIVYRALDPIVSREVAVKTPRPEVLISPSLIARFAWEAKAAAQLDHPNIVPVYESGVIGITPYLVSRFASGPTLAKWRTAQSSIDPRIAAKIVHQLAEAVAHAHERGVLHRDLSAGNVLLVPSDSPAADAGLPFIPQLTDFGLAKCLDGSQDKTRTGIVIGTLRNMAPEQIEGSKSNTTAATDIYGLGVILYELLTGEVPFQAESDAQMIRMILHDDAPSIRKAHPQVPRDLELICLKCLQKNSASRYHSARELAQDLRNFLTGDPILARPSTVPERLWKWARKKPALATLLTTAVLGLPVLLGVSVWYNARFSELLGNARKLEAGLRRRAYVSDMRMAQDARDHGNVGEMRKLLARYQPSADQPEVRNFPWWFLSNYDRNSSRILTEHPGGVNTVAIARNSKIGATGGRDGIIRLWSLPQGTPIREWKNTDLKVIEAVTFSPDSSTLAAVDENGFLALFNLSSGQQLFRIQAHTGWIADVKFSPRENLLATAGSDALIKLWNPKTGKLVNTLQGHPKTVRALAFDPVEPVLISTGEYDTVRLWDLRTMKPDSRLPEGKFPNPDPKEWPRSLALDPARQILVAGCRNFRLYTWVYSPHNFGMFRHQPYMEQANPRSLAWSPESPLIVGLTNSTLRIAKREEPMFTFGYLYGHLGSIWSVATAPDQSCLLSGSQDGTARLWPKQALDDFAWRLKGDHLTYRYDWPQCGASTIAAGTERGEIVVFRISDGSRLFEYPAPKSGAFAYSETGGLLLVSDHDNLKLNCIETSSGKTRWSLPTSGRLHTIEFNPSGKFAAFSSSKEVLIVDIEAGKITNRLELPDNGFQVRFLEQNEKPPQVVVTCGDGQIRFWDFQANKITRQIPTHVSGARSVAFSPDRRFMATGGEDRKARIWDLESLTEVASFPHDESILQLEFLTNDLLVTADTCLNVWSIPDEVEMLSLPKICDAGGFAVSPDGRKIFAQTGPWVRVLDGTPQP